MGLGKMMETCQLLETCVFFNDKHIQNLGDLTRRLKIQYCKGQFAQCARYKVARALGRECVPPLMIPNQMDWANEILRDNDCPAYDETILSEDEPPVFDS